MISDLNLYKVFYTVAKCKSISAAAEKLFVSQPAVSKSIKALENNINTTLFIRSSKGVSLTPEGELFYLYIKNGFEEFLLGENILEKIKNKEVGYISLGVSTTIGKNYFLPRFEKFINKYPDFKVNIINKPTLDTIQLVKEGSLDLAIVGLDTKATDLEFIELSKMHDIFIASSEYLNKLNYSSMEDLFDKGSFMLLESPNVTRHHIDNFFASEGLKITPDIEASNMDFLIECVKIGLGITSVVREFVHKELKDGSLVELPLSINIPPRYIGIIYKNSDYLSIATKTLIDFLLLNTT